MALSPGEMERFWDARARENAAYFVDNRIDYRRTDMDEFWASGPAVVDGMLERLGVNLKPTDEVVEIGCGIGRLTRVLAARAKRVWALDVSSEMLERAAKLNPGARNVHWLHGDGVSLAPLEDACADVCFSHVVFQHLPDPELTLGYAREMGRVLRPGGYAAFQISNDPDIHRRKVMLGLRIKAFVGRAPRGQGAAPWLGSAVDLGTLDREAQRAGLRLERVDGAGTQFCFVLLRRLSGGPSSDGP